MTKIQDVTDQAAGDWGAGTAQIQARTTEQAARNAIDFSAPTQPEVYSASLDAVGEVFPAKLDEAFNLLASVQDEYDRRRGRARNRAELADERKILARLDRIKKHCFDLQQGLPALPHMDANALAANRAARHAQPKNRAELIAHLKSLIERDAPAVFPEGFVYTLPGVVPDQLAFAPRDLALADESVKAAATDCVRKFRTYEIFRQEMEAYLDPELAEELARRAMGAAKTPEELTAARKAFVDATEGLKGPAGDAAQHSAKQAVLRAGEAPKAALVELLKAIKGALTGQLIAAKFEESTFFMRFGLYWVQTPVSERIAKALAEIERLIASLSTNDVRTYNMIFNPNNQPLTTWLGVRFDQ